MRLLSTLTATAAVLAFAACGGDDGTGDGAPTDQPDNDTALVDDPPPQTDTEALPPEEFEDVNATAPSMLDVELDELRARTDELFDGQARGQGTGTMAGSSHLIVEVDPSDFTDAELVAACESLTDFVDGLPEDRAAGRVDILISADLMVGPDEDYLVANEGLVVRETRGSCEVQ